MPVFALVDNTTIDVGSGSSATSSARNTSGASLLIAICSVYLGGTPSTETISDDKSNIWIPLTAQDSGSPGNPRSRIYYVLTPTVGTGHHFTISPQFASANILAFSCSGISISYDAKQNGATGTSVSSLATGATGVPSKNDALIIAAVANNTDTIGPTSIDSGFTTVDLVLDNAGGGRYGYGSAYLIQTSASSVNPTWTLNGSAGNAAATLAVFVSSSSLPVPAGSLSFSGGAPGLQLQVSVPSGTLAFSGLAPTLYISPTLMAAGALVYTGYAPSLRLQVGVPAGSLVFTGYVPVITNSRTIAPGAGALTFSGYAPTVSFSYLNPAHVWITENGVTVDPLDGNITEYADETPNRMVFKTPGLAARPSEGDSVYAYLGSPYNNTTRYFGGSITSVQTVDGETNDINLVQYMCTCIDWAWGLQTAPRVNLTFTNVAGDTIANTLIALVAGYTGTHVQASLAVVPLIVFKNASVMDCLKQLRDYLNTLYVGDVNLKVDYFKDVHLTVGADASIPTPVTIDTSHPTLNNFTWTRDILPLVTRAVTSGDGSQTVGIVNPGDTVIPMASAAMFQDGGGFVEVAGGVQRLSYTGRQVGVGGSLVGPGASPSTPPALALASGTGLSAGIYQYAVVDVTASGKTLPSPVASITTGPIAAPSSAPVWPGSGNGFGDGVTLYYGSNYLEWAVTFVTASGETTPGPRLQFNYTVGGGSGVFANEFFPLQNIPTGPAGTTARNIYRVSSTVGYGGTLHLSFTLNDNTTVSATDGTLDANLGAVAPSSALVAQQVTITGIALGASGTTSRELYRTAVGGSQLKLLHTFADNTTTGPYTDSTADGSLGANVPTSDTSGLTVPAGQVLAGSPTLLMAGAGWASTTGGWALVNGIFIRYTGISGNTLTGIPATGTGSITGTIAYNSTVIAASALLGIPASGTGSVQYLINKGDAINLLSIRNDVAAQTALAALLNSDGHTPASDGVFEDYVSLGAGIGQADCDTNGDARLAMNADPIISASWVSNDLLTTAGATVSINKDTVNQSLVIQQVSITQWNRVSLRSTRVVPDPHEYPLFTVSQAGNQRFGLDKFVRSL